MAILKSQIRNKFTNIPNSIIQENKLSDGDFRLLIYLYSLPNGWKINQGYLGLKLGCNRRNISAKIGRIKEAGYLDIIKNNNTKNVDYIYILKEKGVSSSDVSVNDVSSSDASVNDSYINTNIINTKEIKNSSSSKNIFSYIEDNFLVTVNGTNFEKIKEYLKCYDDDVLCYAIDLCVANGITTLSYFYGIVDSWISLRYRTLEEIKLKDKKSPKEEKIPRRTF